METYSSHIRCDGIRQWSRYHEAQELAVHMTLGQLNSEGSLSNDNKELEMLFQPMFDEHLKQSRVNEPVPSATEFNAQVSSPTRDRPKNFKMAVVIEDAGFKHAR
ncbi:hypothetical protein Tco_0709018 [Tanacetum coccineum]